MGIIVGVSVMAKVLICGDRNWTNWSVIQEQVCHMAIGSAALTGEKLTIIQGGCRGADRIAKQCCNASRVNCLTFDAEWDRYGPAAGPIRNRLMLDQKPDMVIAFHDNLRKSKGTRDTVMEARKRGIPVMVINSQGKPVEEADYV